MTESIFPPDLLADVEAGQALALTIHNDVIVPANPSFEVRMFAIAALAAEFAAMLSETPDAAGDMIDAIAEAEQARHPLRFRREGADRRRAPIVRRRHPLRPSLPNQWIVLVNERRSRRALPRAAARHAIGQRTDHGFARV